MVPDFKKAPGTIVVVDMKPREYSYEKHSGHAADCPACKAGIPLTTASMCGRGKTVRALLVILLNDQHRAYLERNDPKALEQILTALEANGVKVERHDHPDL